MVIDGFWNLLRAENGMIAV